MGLVTIVGYYVGQVARLIKLPSLIGYIIVGVVAGPSLFHILNDASLHDLSFITEIALGIVAFSIGTELELASLKRLGNGIISIIFAESFAAFIIVGIAVYILTRDLPLALLFGAVAPASAPAGTVAVIQEYRAKGNLTKALYAVVGFDDGLAIIIFGFAAAIAKNILIGQAISDNFFLVILAPAKEIGLSILVGTGIGFVFCQLVGRINNSREVLILTIGTILIATGLSIRFHLSLILTNLVIGFIMANLRREALTHKVMTPILDISPLLFVLFFSLAGAHLKISALQALGGLGLVYMIARASGLMLGARIGGMIGNVDEKVKKYVGLGILSQAGVAIGLSLIINQEFSQIAVQYNIPHAKEIGNIVLTTIAATCIVFEIVGPICTRIALRKAGEIPDHK